MPWKPVREVRVKTRAELEAAMRSADRIVVDGDASLAAYAAALAGGGAFDEPHAAPAMRLRPIGDMERAAHTPRTGRPPRLWPWVAGAAVVLAGAAAALLREHFARLASSQTAAAAPMDASLLLWPAVAVALLLALFFAIRQAAGKAVHAPVSWCAEAPGAAQLGAIGGPNGGKGRIVMTRVRRHPA